MDSASLLLSHYSRESETLPTKIQEQERTLKNPNVTLFALTNQVNKNPNNANLENVCSLRRFVVSFAIRRSVIVLGAFSSSRLSGRARLRRALTGHIELSSASVDDPEMQLGEVCV